MHGIHAGGVAFSRIFIRLMQKPAAGGQIVGVLDQQSHRCNGQCQCKGSLCAIAGNNGQRRTQNAACGDLRRQGRTDGHIAHEGQLQRSTHGQTRVHIAQHQTDQRAHHDGTLDHGVADAAFQKTDKGNQCDQ